MGLACWHGIGMGLGAWGRMGLAWGRMGLAWGRMGHGVAWGRMGLAWSRMGPHGVSMGPHGPACMGRMGPHQGPFPQIGVYAGCPSD